MEEESVRPVTPDFLRYLIASLLVLPTLMAAAFIGAELVAARSAMAEGFTPSTALIGLADRLSSHWAADILGMLGIGAVVCLFSAGVQFLIWGIAKRIVRRSASLPPLLFVAMGGLVSLLPLQQLWSMSERYIRHSGPTSSLAALFIGVCLVYFGTVLAASHIAVSAVTPWQRSSDAPGWLLRVFTAWLGAMTIALYAVGWDTPRFATGSWRSDDPGATINLWENDGGTAFVALPDQEILSSERVRWVERGRTVTLYLGSKKNPGGYVVMTGVLSPDDCTMTLPVPYPPEKGVAGPEATITLRRWR